MTTHNDMALCLRDAEGNFYIVSSETWQAGRVPDNKKQALQDAISGDVSGFLFDTSSFQNAFAGLSQNNTNIGSNYAVGGLIGLNNQSLSQLGLNIGSVSNTQARL